MKITNEIIENFYECQYKAFLKLHGLRGQKCNLEKLLIDESKERRNQFCKKKLNRAFPKQAVLLATNGSCFGDSFLANVEIRYENFQLKCDFFKKVTAPSAKVAVSYVPTLIVPTDKVSKKNKILITAIAYVIGKILNVPIDYGIITSPTDFKSTKVRVRQHFHELQSFVGRVQENEEPQFRLNSHCTVCEFSPKCKERATKEDHLSLLKGISADRLNKLNKKGIFTVNQLSYTFRPKGKPLVNVQRNSTRSFELQALAIREKKIFVYDIPDVLPRARTEMFLDVEGLPDKDFYYLIGLTIKTPESLTHHSYWISGQNDAREVAAQFLHTLGNYNEFVIYHYGAYEVEFLRSLKKVCVEFKEYDVDGIIKRCFNILSLIYTHLYFPTYSNGLRRSDNSLASSGATKNRRV